ncbi:hypothetical protein LIER_31272 [Lithospermum erythrorhizon]|uniref:Uncharacterized protein n=1 Tax=Lithospermum erythrorhizon TaxID=34254 RepID=A0AAV3RUF3_LITER
MVESAEEKVLVCEGIFETSGLAVDRENLGNARADHLRYLAMEEDYWKQKSSIRWVQEGDRSTAFYHSWVKQRRLRKAIAGTLIDGDWVTDKALVADSVVRHFQSAFQNHTAAPVERGLIDCIPSIITVEDNDYLIALPMMEELKR